MAGQLAAVGEDTALLALFDSAAPVPGAYEAADEATLLAGLAQSLQIAAPTPLRLLPEADLRQLDAEARLRYLGAIMGQANGLPPAPDPAQVRRFWAVYVAHVRAAGRYRPRFYPGPVLLFRAAEALPGTVPRAVRADPALGWQAFVRRPVAVRDVPGNHETILREPHVRVLAAGLRAALGEI
jgi:thioesterase domain-containing protein